MTKIYNEIVIDMNPESSSYGETLHEDSFEYEGPMALLINPYALGLNILGAKELFKDTFKDAPGGTTQAAAALQNTKGYVRHQTFDGFYLMERTGIDGALEWVIYDDQLNIKQTLDESYDYEQAVNRVRDHQTKKTKEEAPGYVEGPLEVAPDINYQDFAQYIDPTTGNVINQEGMIGYLKSLPGMPQDESVLIEMIGEMPNMRISAADQSAAASKTASDIYGLHSGMMETRREASAAAGASGVYSPTSSGFGGGDTSNIYGQLGDVSAQSGNIYGLGGEKEEEFARWIEGKVGGE